MKKILKSTKWLLLLSGILIVILGITMLFTPLQSLVSLAFFVGIAMTVSGIAELITYFGEEAGFRSGWMLASGIISALLGIWTIFGSGSSVLLTVLPYIFAVWIMTSSITRIAGSLSLKSEGYGQWGWVLALGIAGTVLGFLLLFSPMLSGMLVIYALAAMLILYGMGNLLLFFRLNRLGNRLRRHLNQ